MLREDLRFFVPYSDERRADQHPRVQLLLRNGWHVVCCRVFGRRRKEVLVHLRRSLRPLLKPRALRVVRSLPAS